MLTKIKSFLSRHKKLSVVLVVLLIPTITVGAAVGYLFFNGTTGVTVEECMMVENIGGDNGSEYTIAEEGSAIWNISMYAGETRTLNIRVTNNSTASLVVNLTAPESYSHLAVGWNVESAVVAGNSYTDFTLTVTADGSIAVGTYSIPFYVSRTS